MDEREFKDLIQRYQNNTCTPEEKRQIDSWLVSMGDDERFEKWEIQRQEQLRNKMLRSIEVKKEQHPLIKVIQHFPLLKIAATILILFTAFLVFYHFNTLDTRQTITNIEAVSTGGIRKYILPDGTLVWLKGKSKLYYPTTFTGNQRKVRLEGEALFEVTKDPSHPFIIRCGALLTKVVGTSFNIKSQPDYKQVEVFVFTGKVSLSDSTEQKEVFVRPNQKALYKTKTGELITTDERRVTDYLIGTEYEMVFEDTPLSEVVARIEQKFDIEIKLENQSKHCLISADLTDQSLTTTLELITQSMGGEFKQDGKSARLKIPNCP